MLDAILMDWEGVLISTAAARRSAMLQALRDEALPTDDLAYDALAGGRSVHEAATNMLVHSGRRDATLAEIVTMRARRAFADQLVNGFVLCPGAREFMLHMQLKTRIAIVTTASRLETELVLRHAQLEDCVTTVVSGDDALELPPQPHLYQRALAQLGRSRTLRTNSVIALASTTAALRAARAACVRTVAVAAPAHVAVEADGAMSGVNSVTSGELLRLAGIATARRDQ